MFAVLKGLHLMVGVDYHCPWVPPPPPLPVPSPYVTAQTMLGFMVTSKYSERVVTMWGPTMLAGTDIGPLIGHAGTPSSLLPIEIPLSASKSYFGSSQYTIGGKRVACCLGFIVNPNLNCGTPLPTPTGVAMAPTTHFVGMTLGDLAVGIGVMFRDFLVMAALSKIMPWAGKGLGALGSGASRLSARLGSKAFLQSMRWLPTMNMKYGLKIGLDAASKLLGDPRTHAALGFFVGSPLGTDSTTFLMDPGKNYAGVKQFFGMRDVDEYGAMPNPGDELAGNGGVHL